MEAHELMRNELKTYASYNAGAALMNVDFRKVVKLNANESQMGPSPKAMKAMAEEMQYGYLYPQTVINELKTKLAAYAGKSEDEITIFAGSGGGIQEIGETFLNPGDECVLCSPTYMAYYRLPARFGAVLKEVNAPDGVTTDLNLLLDAVTEKTKIVFLCNPNNPTGTLLPAEAIEDFVMKLPKHVICLVDEAYIDWVDDRSYPSAFRLVREDTNVIVLRTFSKIHGMAGYRIGYAVANRKITECMKAVAGYYSTNRIAARGAIVSMEDTEYLEKVYQNNKTQRDYMQSELKKMGMKVTPSQASFIYFDPCCDAEEMYERLQQKKIYIRPFIPFLRVSIGKPDQNQAFLNAMKEVIAQMK